MCSGVRQRNVDVSKDFATHVCPTFAKEIVLTEKVCFGSQFVDLGVEEGIEVFVLTFAQNVDVIIILQLWQSVCHLLENVTLNHHEASAQVLYLQQTIPDLRLSLLQVHHKRHQLGTNLFHFVLRKTSVLVICPIQRGQNLLVL